MALPKNVTPQTPVPPFPKRTASDGEYIRVKSQAGMNILLHRNCCSVNKLLRECLRLIREGKIKNEFPQWPREYIPHDAVLKSSFIYFLNSQISKDVDIDFDSARRAGLIRRGGEYPYQWLAPGPAEYPMEPAYATQQHALSTPPSPHGLYPQAYTPNHPMYNYGSAMAGPATPCYYGYGGHASMGTPVQHQGYYPNATYAEPPPSPHTTYTSHHWGQVPHLQSGQPMCAMTGQTPTSWEYISPQAQAFFSWVGNGEKSAGAPAACSALASRLEHLAIQAPPAAAGSEDDGSLYRGDGGSSHASLPSSGTVVDEGGAPQTIEVAAGELSAYIRNYARSPRGGGINKQDADRYAHKLVEEGFDTIDSLLDLSAHELKKIVRLKRGHFPRIEMMLSRAQRAASPAIARLDEVDD